MSKFLKYTCFRSGRETVATSLLFHKIHYLSFSCAVKTYFFIRSKMFSQIAVHNIRDNFYHSQYGTFSVVIDKDNGFINATKLCSDGNKCFRHWNETKQAKELIAALNNHILSIEAFGEDQRKPWTTSHYCPPGKVSNFIQTANQTDEDKLISGTYCHPLLIPHIACWVCPNFALQVASIINHYFVEEWQNRLENAVEEMRNMRHALEDIEQHHLALQCTVDESNTKIQIKDEVINSLEENIDNEIRDKETWASTHSFTLLRINDPNSICMPYYGIRCQRRSMSRTINKLRRKHPNAEVLFQQMKIPNAVNLFSRLKVHKAIKAQRNYFLSLQNDEKELITLISSLCNTNYPPRNVTPFNAWQTSNVDY